jgi:hypothetical protein
MYTYIMATKRKRPQKPKGMGNRAMTDAMLGKRFSNAAGAHTPKTAYKRKSKYGKGWE